MSEEKFLEVVAEILEVEAAELSLEDSLSDLGWDSLCDIGFIAAMDEESGKTVAPDALKVSKTVADLFALA